MRLVARRMPFATTRTLPKCRVKRTRMRSASAKSLVLRTIASARYVRDDTVASMVRNADPADRLRSYHRNSGGTNTRHAPRGDRRRDPLALEHRGSDARTVLRDDALPPRARRRARFIGKAASPGALHARVR